MRTLVVTTGATDATAATVPTVRREHAERIEAAAAEVLSANTRRAYARAWRAWVAWCASEGVEPMPAPPILVTAYLAERGEAGAGIATLRTAVAAIAHEHGSRGAPSPATHPGERRVLRGIARRQASEGRTPQQAAALIWADVKCLPDGTGRLTVRRSKADQTGVGAELFIGLDATAALVRIRPESPAPESPVFGGLGGRAIAERIRKAARAAGPYDWTSFCASPIGASTVAHCWRPSCRQRQ